MNVEVVTKKSSGRLPEIGECWAWREGVTHGNAFMRVVNTSGVFTPASIWSIHLDSGEPFSMPAGTPTTDIVILRPVGGVLKLEVAQ